MRELASFRAPGRAGGIDDRCQVGSAALGPALPEQVIADRCAGCYQRVQLSYLPDAQVKGLKPGAGGVDDLCVRARLGEHGAGTRVAEHPLDLLGRRCLVDRHRDGARRPDRVVDQRPLIARPRHQGDPVTRFYPGLDNPPGKRRHLIAERGSGHVLPLAGAGQPPQHDGVRLPARAGEDDIREAGGVGYFCHCGSAVPAHGFSSASRYPDLPGPYRAG